jgi:hypothetical protein
MSGSTEQSSGPTPSDSPKPSRPWAGLGYEQVRGLANRIIARYLRGQRRNMERFFQERGLLESAERMRQIRLSRQGMLAKNRMFQEVLGEYARGATATASAEADSVEGSRSADMVLPAEAAVPESVGSGSDAGGSVPVVAVEDSGPVIEE